MIFEPLTVADAEGAILAHGISVGGKKFKKGRVLSAGDVKVLEADGVETVIGARLESDDVPEDEAAQALAKISAGGQVRIGAPFTGRANLYAEARGLAVIDRDQVDRINLLHEAVTVATVEPFAIIEPRQMVGTVKIIPFAAPRSALDAAMAIAGAPDPLIRVARFEDKAVGLVSTQLAGMKESLLDKTTRAVTDRLTFLGAHLAGEIRCAHTAEAVSGAIKELIAKKCDPVLVFGASAITDRRDVIPAGIEAAGGTVDHFGMPVDPGNLLLLGHIGSVPVIGLPGCARSPKENGFDWVLQRLLANVSISREDIMRMGAGGLLLEITSRPQPRDGEILSYPKAPRIAAIILAAGQSRRMGADNKMLAEIEGKSLVRHAAEAALASDVDTVLVVTGHESTALKAALKGLDVRFADNPDYAEGLSTSLRVGVAALSADKVDGALVCLGDMPDVGADHLNKLIAAYDPGEDRGICVPTYEGKRGNPVLWGADYFAEIQTIRGDVGARHLVGTHEDVVCEVPMDKAVTQDIDTLDDLKARSGNK